MAYKIFDWFFGVTLVFSFLVLSSCNGKSPNTSERVGVLSQMKEVNKDIVTGAENIALYLPSIEGKSVAMVVNQTSLVGERHIVDTLLKYKVDIKKIFAPEHGFRGNADAGEIIKDGKDAKTGIPVYSLYGKKKKPSKSDLEGIDVVIFDIQDVGARFYTYISSLHYVMEACAEEQIPVIVLDRPNPNAHYVDGPILEKELKSFVGMHPVPVVYGMTIGEYAQMINGEGWLSNQVKADLTVIRNNNYTHDSFYELPVKPSPNLPNSRSILLYPSLCFFEGTRVSAGRGTDSQFQIYGHPTMNGEFSFTPESKEGAKFPKHENKKCTGVDLQSRTIGSLIAEKQINLSFLMNAYANMNADENAFFLANNFFDKLAGTTKLKEQIIAGKSETEIRASWKSGINSFLPIREKYLLYD